MEPTIQRIKEAFNKTIERWEKIFENIGWYKETKCPLCILFGGGRPSCNSKLCPIGIYTNRSMCVNTPFEDFRDHHTQPNALAELNFLRKVYIWWMEEEANKIWDKHGIAKPKEEKKEEWVDITENVDWKLYNLGHGNYYWVRGYYEDKFIVWMDTEGIHAATRAENYHIKIEKEDMSFRILKKV